jgi:hypothetical protein
MKVSKTPQVKNFFIIAWFNGLHWGYMDSDITWTWSRKESYKYMTKREAETMVSHLQTKNAAHKFEIDEEPRPRQ